jgi:hypothetical protein
MVEEIASALGAVLQRLAALASSDANIRAELRKLAQILLEATEEKTVAGEEPIPHSAPVAEIREPVADRAGPAEIIPQTGLGQAGRGIEIPLGLASWKTMTDDELPLVEVRCRLKAEGARWAAERRRRLKSGADYEMEIEPKDRELIAKAKQIEGCFLWMNHPSGPCPEDLSLFDNLSGSFEALADSVSLMLRILSGNRPGDAAFEKALDLTAEAQSALRTAVLRFDGQERDSDQYKVYQWLRMTAGQHQIYIRRFMRLDDSADPSTWMSIIERIARLDERLTRAEKQEKQRRKWMSQIRYHMGLVRSGSGTEYDWRKIVDVAAALVADGLPPSNAELRELLLPLVEEMPEMSNLPAEFRMILEEIDRFLAMRPPIAIEVPPEPSPQVREAAALLEGKNVVLIGGEQRMYARDALRDALRLNELVWISTDPHQSLETCVPLIARPDVTLVLLAIRWTSHSYGEAQQLCNRYGKPLVRLPGGYNSNQVAFQILQQCGERLHQMT